MAEFGRRVRLKTASSLGIGSSPIIGNFLIIKDFNALSECL